MEAGKQSGLLWLCFPLLRSAAPSSQYPQIKTLVLSGEADSSISRNNKVKQKPVAAIQEFSND